MYCDDGFCCHWFYKDSAMHHDKEVSIVIVAREVWGCGIVLKMTQKYYNLGFFCNIEVQLGGIVLCQSCSASSLV